jgi:hypothetical protein
MKKIGISILVLTMIISIFTGVVFASESSLFTKNETISLFSTTTDNHSDLEVYNLNEIDTSWRHHGPGEPDNYRRRPHGPHGHRRRPHGSYGPRGDSFLLLFTALAIVALIGGASDQ